MSRFRFWRRHDEIPVVELNRTSPVRFAIVFLVIIAIAIYFGFTKHLPFKHGYRLNAQFASALNIKGKSPVRIAGVNVGKVTAVKRDGSTALVSMEIEGRGLPIHSDATVKIRPRIFLEGNWFVELQPGSPSAKTLSSGSTLPSTQSSDPVQIDQVLDALNSDTRQNLQDFLIGYGNGLVRKPSAADNAEQDADVRGINAAEALNKTYGIAPKAERGAAIVNQAIGGTETHDLSKLVRSVGKVTAALNVHEQQLGELIGNFNSFFHSFAAQSSSLRSAVAVLPSSLRKITAGLRELDAAFPPARTFALDILPGVKSTPQTVTALLPWIEQVEASLAPTELGGVAKGLLAATPPLAQLTAEQTTFQVQTEAFNKCLTKVIIPAGNTTSAGRDLDFGRGGLQGVLVRPDRRHRNRPDLRRQRYADEVPARQRRSDGPLGTVDRRGQEHQRPEAGRARLAGPRKARARRSPKPSRPTSRSCPATRRRCLNSTARSRRAPRTVPDNGCD